MGIFGHRFPLYKTYAAFNLSIFFSIKYLFTQFRIYHNLILYIHSILGSYIVLLFLLLSIAVFTSSLLISLSCHIACCWWFVFVRRPWLTKCSRRMSYVLSVFTLVFVIYAFGIGPTAYNWLCILISQVSCTAFCSCSNKYPLKS